MIKKSKQKAIQMSELTCRLAKACNKKESSFAALFGLTPMELKCLRMFSKDSTVSIRDMIKELEITAGRVTHILTSLEKKDYIRRKVDEKDKRNYFVEITPTSRKFINQLTQKHIALHQDILDSLKIKDPEMIFNVMNNLISSLEYWADTNKAKLKK